MCILLGVAAWKDIRCYKVSNWIILIGFLIGVVYQISMNGIIGIWYWGQGILLPCILFILFLSLKMIGAADIKLFAVISGMYGITFFCNVVLWSLLLGAIFSFVFMIKYQNFYVRFQYLFQYITELMISKQIKPYYVPHKNDNKYIIPFALPIFISTLICLFASEKVLFF